MWGKNASIRSYTIISVCLMLTIAAASYTLEKKEEASILKNRIVTQSKTGDVHGLLRTEDAAAEIELGHFRVGVLEYKEDERDAVLKEKALNKLETELESALSFDVELISFLDYGKAVEALTFGQIQLAFLGTSTYVVANELSGAQAIAALTIDDQPYTYSYIITHAAFPWNSLDELVQHASDIRFAFSGTHSNSGMFIPSIELIKQGVYQDEDSYQFKSVTDTGSHEATAVAIQMKQVDAGAIDSAYYTMLVDHGLLDENQIKIIWKSEPLFYNPWVVSYQVDQKLIDLLQTTFEAMDDADILDYFSASGFTPVSNEDYDEIRKAMQENGKLFLEPME